MLVKPLSASYELATLLRSIGLGSVLNTLSFSGKVRLKEMAKEMERANVESSGRVSFHQKPGKSIGHTHVYNKWEWSCIIGRQG